MKTEKIKQQKLKYINLEVIENEIKQIGIKKVIEKLEKDFKEIKEIKEKVKNSTAVQRYLYYNSTSEEGTISNPKAYMRYVGWDKYDVEIDRNFGYLKIYFSFEVDASNNYFYFYRTLKINDTKKTAAAFKTIEKDFEKVFEYIAKKYAVCKIA